MILSLSHRPAGGEALGPGWAGQPEHLSVIGIIIYLDGKGVLRFFWTPKRCITAIFCFLRGRLLLPVLFVG